HNTFASVWTPNGSGGYTLRELGANPALANSHGLAINASGQVAGAYVRTFVGTFNAFLWKDDGSAAGTMVDLGDPNALGSDTIFAVAVNDGGTVAGMGFDFGGSGGFRAFVWRPT